MVAERCEGEGSSSGYVVCIVREDWGSKTIGYTSLMG